MMSTEQNDQKERLEEAIKCLREIQTSVTSPSTSTNTQDDDVLSGHGEQQKAESNGTKKAAQNGDEQNKWITTLIEICLLSLIFIKDYVTGDKNNQNAKHGEQQKAEPNETKKATQNGDEQNKWITTLIELGLMSLIFIKDQVRGDKNNQNAKHGEQQKAESNETKKATQNGDEQNKWIPTLIEISLMSLIFIKDQVKGDKNNQNAKLSDNLEESGRKSTANEENKTDPLNSFYDKLIGLIYELQKKADELKSKITSRKGCIVYIHSNHHSKTMTMISKELEQKLRLHLKSFGVDFIVLNNIKDMLQGSPLLALCIDVTRLKTDAVNAIMGVKELKNTVLVVFHHKESRALTFSPSRQLLTGQKFDTLHGIFDMAFLEETVIYPCAINTEAINGIVAFVKNYIKTEVKPPKQNRLLNLFPCNSKR